MKIDFLILLIGLELCCIPFFHIFESNKTKSKTSSRLKYTLMFLASVISLVIAGMLNETDMAEVIYIFAIVPGIFLLSSVLAFRYDKGIYSEQREMTLKKDDYKCVMQDGTHINAITLPIGQDFPYIDNYLYLPKSDEYILITKKRLTEAHDIRITIVPIEKYGKSIYECMDFEILDNRKSSLEKYTRFMSIFAWITLFLGMLPLAYVMTCVVPTPPNTILPSWVTNLGYFCLLGAVGGCASSFMVNGTENKIIKSWWLIFGGISVLIGLCYLVGLPYWG